MPYHQRESQLFQNRALKNENHRINKQTNKALRAALSPALSIQRIRSINRLNEVNDVEMFPQRSVFGFQFV